MVLNPHYRVGQSVLRHPNPTLKHEKPARNLNENKCFTEEEKILFIK